MTPANPLATPSLVLSGLVLTAAGFLAVRQLREQSDRDDGEFSDADHHHHHRQDVRRWRGIILMGLIGLAASTGFWINPAASPDRARLVFGAWVVVGVLLLALVALAGLDWIQIVAQARRHRQDLVEERQALLEALQHHINRRHPPDDNGHPT